MNTVGDEDFGDELWVCQLGTVPYLDAVALQEAVHAQRRAGAIPDTLLLVEHDPVFTRGRRSRDEEMVLGEAFYRSRGVDVIGTNRGGRVTYHGPGQLVGYPIMRIDSTHLHLRRMEQAIIEALADEGIDARSRCAEGPDYTGVWVEDRKIASIGVHVARGITTHGFAVNVDLDLTPFSWVVACGLPGTEMTSVAGELRGGSNRGTESAGQVDAGSRVDRFARPMVARFCERHGRHPRFVSPAELTLAPMPGEPVAELQAFVS